MLCVERNSKGNIFGFWISIFKEKSGISVVQMGNKSPWAIRKYDAHMLWCTVFSGAQKRVR